jgi:putative mRNA 3-end processing factor
VIHLIEHRRHVARTSPAFRPVKRPIPCGTKRIVAMTGNCLISVQIYRVAGAVLRAILKFMAQTPILTFTDRGIYCPDGDFYIDPWRPVTRALITHAHSDHARFGHGAYLSTPGTDVVMRHRLGAIVSDTIAYGVARQIGGVSVSFHPAGHVPGSAMIRVERGGEVWVVSGDYKVEADGLAEPWEPVACHTFISECTFGLPVFRWEDNARVMGRIRDWWAGNAAAGKVSILGAYSLGKAQRLMVGVAGVGPILTHGAVERTCEALRTAGYAIPDTVQVGPGVDGKSHPGALVIAPPSALGTPWAARFGPAESAFASGWMALRGVRRRRGTNGFVVSDHADWPGLNMAIKAMGAARVFVTHGYTTTFRKWLESQGYEAGVVATEYEGEASEAVVEQDAPA